MSFDGEYVTDSEHDTIEAAQEASANMGSRWIFYPFHIIVKNLTVKEMGGMYYNVETHEALLDVKFRNKRFTTVKSVFEKCSKLPEAQGMDCEEFENLLLAA